MGNDAINTHGRFVNGAFADIGITSHGSNFFFAICAAMGAAGLAFTFLASRKHPRDRVFHYITAAVVWVAAIAYFTMGSNLGFTPIEVEFRRSDRLVRGQYREIFWVRYVDWFITTPLLLMDLLLTAGMPWPIVLFTILVDEIMIVTGLIGALLRSSYKWAYFTFGCVALLYILYQLLIVARKRSIALGADVKKVYFMCGMLTAFLWLLYPIAWGLSEGGNVISPDSEAVFYGILDFLAKPVFGALLLWGHRNIDPARLGLQISGYDDDPTVHGREKAVPVAGHPITVDNTPHNTVTAANTGLHTTTV